ncbi:hypothetical protein BU15DRAFT_64309 [Melanogaster broomeanus]|nr:hypothetical protein BU15DRAFT_64309 [Melanogaster broomeanus]
MALLGVLLSFGAASLFTLGLVKVPGGYRVRTGSAWPVHCGELTPLSKVSHVTLGGTVPYFIRGLAGGAVVAVLRYVYHAGKVHQTSSPDIESGHSTTLSEHLQVLNEHLQALIKKLVKQAFKFVFRLDVKEDNGVEICKSLKSLRLQYQIWTQSPPVTLGYIVYCLLPHHLLVTYIAHCLRIWTQSPPVTLGYIVYCLLPHHLLVTYIAHCLRIWTQSPPVTLDYIPSYIAFSYMSRNKRGERAEERRDIRIYKDIGGGGTV